MKNGNTEPELDARPAIGVLSIDARMLTKRLLEIPPDGSITFEELGAVIGRDARWLQAKGRYLIYSALRVCQREHRVEFGAVHGIGLKRLTDVEIVATGVSGTEHIKRTAKKALKKLGNVQDYVGLPADVKVQHNLHASLLGLVYQSSKPKVLAALEAKVTDSTLPLTKALGALTEVL